MEKVYTDPANPAAFGSIRNLAKASKVSHREAREWLETQDAYNKHRQRRIHFPRIRFSVPGLMHTYQMDLADMQNVSKYNRGIKYLLVAMDVFSRFLWCVPLKSKKGPVVAKALDKIFKDKAPLYVNTDRGTEFTGSASKKKFKKYGVHHHMTISDTKAALIERLIRTLKNSIYRYFSLHGTRRYIHVFSQLVRGYNRRIHRSIKMAPLR